MHLPQLKRRIAVRLLCELKATSPISINKDPKISFAGCEKSVWLRKVGLVAKSRFLVAKSRFLVAKSRSGCLTIGGNKVVFGFGSDVPEIWNRVDRGRFTIQLFAPNRYVYTYVPYFLHRSNRPEGRLPLLGADELRLCSAPDWARGIVS